MAHMMKMTKAMVGHMMKHYERAKDENGEYIKFGNQDIDTEQSFWNYNLAPERVSQGEFIKQRCQEVYCLNRKDVNVACSWIVTLTKDFCELNPDTNTRNFFKDTYDFLESRYGKENVVSAYVHLDETTPHLHFCFVPVISDPKKGLKVSAKECVNKRDLMTFHEDLRKYLLQEHGLNCSILNQATIDGNKTISELKKQSTIEELQKAQQATQNAKGELDIMEDMKNDLQVELEHLRNNKNILEQQKQNTSEKLSETRTRLEKLKREETTLEGQIDALKGKLLTEQEVKQLEIKKPIFGGERAIVKIPYEDLLSLKRTAEQVQEWKEQAKKALKIMVQAEDIIEKAKIQAKEIIDEAKSTEKKLDYYKKQIEQERKIQDLSLKIDSVNKVLEQMPEKEKRGFLNACRAVVELQKSGTNKKHDRGFER